jgi:BACON domain-containing protein
MSKRKARSQQTRVANHLSRRRTFFVIILALSLVAASAALANWKGLWPESQKQASGKDAQVAPASLTSPSKEYIYAGGRLIATEEEPSGSGGCTYSISPQSQNFSAAVGSGNVSVTAGTGCNWTATTSDNWISITSGSSGTGNGTVSYSVQPNGGLAHTGTMTIAGQPFTVTQAAGPMAM